MSATAVDERNAQQYALNELRLARITHLFKKFPHIGSHLKYEIKPADYPHPPELKAKLVEVTITQTLCQMLTCNTATPDQPCTAASLAQFYRVDESTFEVACQPACYHLLPKAVYDKNNKEVPHIMPLTWNPKTSKCVLTSAMKTWMELPLYRSTERYAERVNNIPLGFSPIVTQQTQSGVGYRVNEAYCTVFNDNWKDGECKESLDNTIVGAVIGNTLYNYIKAGVNVAITGHQYPLPSGMKPQPDTPPMQVDAWLKNVDSSFQPPPPPEDLGPARMRRAATLTEATTKKGDEGLDWQAIANQIGETLTLILREMIHMLITPEFWVQMGIQVSAEMSSKLIANLLRMCADTLIPRLAEAMVGKSVSLFAWRASMRLAFVHAVVKAIVPYVGAFAAASARILASAVSLVGIILIITQIFDIILTVWDPLGFTSKYPPELLTRLVLEGEMGLRRQLQLSDLSFTFDHLCTILIDQRDEMEISLGGIHHMYDYLSRLTTNSEGSVIYHGPTVQVEPLPATKWLAQAKQYTAKDFLAEEETHTERQRYYDTIRTGLLLVSAAVVGLILLEAYVVAFVLVILGVCLLGVGYANVYFPVSALLSRYGPGYFRYV